MTAADVTNLKASYRSYRPFIDDGFRKFWWISWISIFRPTLDEAGARWTFMPFELPIHPTAIHPIARRHSCLFPIQSNPINVYFS